MKDKSNQIAVHKIDIKIGDKTISLKPEQAKELKKILNEMFEESKVVHEHHYVNRYWWNYPTYIPSTYPNWTITCGAIGNTSALSNTTSYNSGNVTLCLNAA